MNTIFFGYAPREGKGASKLAVVTEVGELEPMEPSKVKVYVRRVSSAIYGSIVPFLGLILGVLSYPV
jgi:hypothetical protein